MTNPGRAQEKKRKTGKPKKTKGKPGKIPGETKKNRKNTKNMKNILKCYSGMKPILGVCLGMQGIAQYYGAELKQEYVTHGKKSKVKVDLDSVLFQNTSEYIDVGLYHSWHIEKLNEEIFNSVSINEKGVLMAIESLELSLFGVQFHPESIMTPLGRTILQNFLNYENYNL